MQSCRQAMIYHQLPSPSTASTTHVAPEAAAHSPPVVSPLIAAALTTTAMTTDIQMATVPHRSSAEGSIASVACASEEHLPSSTPDAGGEGSQTGPSTELEGGRGQSEPPVQSASLPSGGLGSTSTRIDDAACADLEEDVQLPELEIAPTRMAGGRGKVLPLGPEASVGPRQHAAEEPAASSDSAEVRTRATGKSERSEDGLGGGERGLVSEVCKHVNLTISLKEVRALRYVVAASIILTYSCFSCAYSTGSLPSHGSSLRELCWTTHTGSTDVYWFFSGWPDRR